MLVCFDPLQVIGLRFMEVPSGCQTAADIKQVHVCLMLMEYRVNLNHENYKPETE